MTHNSQLIFPVSLVLYLVSGALSLAPPLAICNDKKKIYFCAYNWPYSINGYLPAGRQGMEVCKKLHNGLCYLRHKE